jgi:hypothetical protein
MRTDKEKEIVIKRRMALKRKNAAIANELRHRLNYSGSSYYRDLCDGKGY